MTDEDVVERFQEAVGGVGKLSGPHHPPSLKPHHKEYWEWNLYGKNCVPVVKEMLPYLGLRRRVRALKLLAWYGESTKEVAEGEGGAGESF